MIWKMKTDETYSVDSILQRFMEEIPLDSFSEQYLRDHYICFSIVESIKAEYSSSVITEQDYVNLDSLNEPVKKKSSYVGLNTSSQRVYAAERTPYPSKEVIDEIHNRFGLTGWTVEEIIYNKITSFKISIPVCFIIPDIGDNISFVNNVMASFGYYNIASSQERIYNMDYVYVIYNPVTKFNCNEWLKDKLRKSDYLLYHMTTPDAVESIKKSGLLLNTSKGESRLYFYVGGQFSKEFLLMMKKSLMMRTGKTDGALIGVYPDELLDSVQFYYDPNLDNAVFCNQCVSVDDIDLRHIRFVNVEKMLL